MLLADRDALLIRSLYLSPYRQALGPSSNPNAFRDSVPGFPYRASIPRSAFRRHRLLFMATERLTLDDTSRQQEYSEEDPVNKKYRTFQMGGRFFLFGFSTKRNSADEVLPTTRTGTDPPLRSTDRHLTTMTSMKF